MKKPEVGDIWIMGSGRTDGIEVLIKSIEDVYAVSIWQSRPGSSWRDENIPLLDLNGNTFCFVRSTNDIRVGCEVEIVKERVSVRLGETGTVADFTDHPYEHVLVEISGNDPLRYSPLWLKTRTPAMSFETFFEELRTGDRIYCSKAKVNLFVVLQRNYDDVMLSLIDIHGEDTQTTMVLDREALELDWKTFKGTMRIEKGAGMDTIQRYKDRIGIT